VIYAYGGGWGGGGVFKKRCYGSMPFYRQLSRCWHYFESWMRRDGSSYAPLTSHDGHVAKKYEMPKCLCLRHAVHAILNWQFWYCGIIRKLSRISRCFIISKYVICTYIVGMDWTFYGYCRYSLLVFVHTLSSTRLKATWCIVCSDWIAPDSSFHNEYRGVVGIPGICLPA
jgi:hypothetical protein